MTAAVPFNYRYLVDHAIKHGGRILDYGCGIGQTIDLGIQRGVDIWGVDTFQNMYTEWLRMVKPEIKDRILQIKDGHADFPDQHFDLVFSNQVLEHVLDPEAVIADIHRVLKPGGVFIGAFPVTETWYEGHVGLYFAHRFPAGSSWRTRYFDVCHRLGFGLYRQGRTRDNWIAMSEETLDKSCFYYPRNRLLPALEKTFGTKIEDLGVDYMRTRLGDRARYVPAVTDPLLRFIYHFRAGQVLRIRKPAIG